MHRRLLQRVRTWLAAPPDPHVYTPTFYLRHHFLQSLYELASPQIPIDFDRQYIHFDDGGHMALDWSDRDKAEQGRPIVVVMHGMTGGSETKYIKVLVQAARDSSYCCVCINSRGINSKMTSPIPFTGVQFHEIDTALARIRVHYPQNPVYMIGTSLGGNYSLRYVLAHPHCNVNGLVLISPPFDVKYVTQRMNQHYQRFFIRSYLKYTILQHEQMKFWWQSGIVDLEHLKQSKSMRDFHQRITIQIMGFSSTDEMFAHFKIKDEDIRNLQVRTLILTARDDPMVGYESFPLAAISSNPNIEFVSTQHGGHLCWFEGLRPSRWYPKPTFEFINRLQMELDKNGGR